MPIAATPAWFADNVAQIAVGTLLVVTVLVVRMVHNTTVRLVLLVLIGLVGVFVYVNRDALTACVRTCECRMADRDIDVPVCDPDLDLSSRVHQ